MYFFQVPKMKFEANSSALWICPIMDIKSRSL